MKIISYSGGLGSFVAAKLTVDSYGPEQCVLVFTDTKTEDEDLYRFLKETAQFLKTKLIELSDGRNIWEVFESVKFHGNNRIDPCSRILKRELFRKWVSANYSPSDCSIIFGIGPSENHRMAQIAKRWEPWEVSAPLIEQNVSKEDCDDILEQTGIAPPALYALGFPHNNCGGFCVKTGQKQMKLLWEKLPKRYAWHEEQQEKLFSVIGKNHGFIRKSTNGILKYLSLKEFRELCQAGTEVEKYEESCGCFV